MDTNEGLRHESEPCKEVVEVDDLLEAMREVMRSTERMGVLLRRMEDRETSTTRGMLAGLESVKDALLAVQGASSKLYDVEHSYYCSDRPYHSSDAPLVFDSWDDFLMDDNGGDFDLNLLFRWDWQSAGDGWGDSLCDHVYLYFMGQRKGLFRSVKVRVTKADEGRVRVWLAPRFEHLKALWRPL